MSKSTVYYFLLAVVLLASSFTATPALASAFPFFSEANYSYSTDSDLVTTRAWRLGTVNEDKPLNLTLYRTRIDQPFRTLTGDMAIAKYKVELKNSDNVNFWLGVSQNPIRNFYPFAIMYDRSINFTDHVWFSYAHESLDTITAYEQRIHTNTIAASLLHSFTPTVEGILDIKHMAYSNANTRKIISLTVTKQLSTAWKLKGGYLYDSASRKVPGSYYVPVQERAFFAGLEWTTLIGKTNLVISGDKSLYARNSDGSIKRHGLGATLKYDTFSAGIRYDRSGDYWAHSWNANWQQNW